MGRFSNDALEFHVVAQDPAVIVGGVVSYSEDLNTEIISPETGQIFDTIQSIASQQPVMTIGVEAIETVIGQVPISGKCIVSDPTHPGLKHYQARHDPCGPNARGAAGTHRSHTVTEGFLFFDTLTAQQGQNVRINLSAHGASADGTTPPVEWAYNETLPTTAINDEQFTLGPPVIGGVELGDVESVNIAFNPQFEKSPRAGAVWPFQVDPQKISAVITIQTKQTCPQVYDATVSYPVKSVILGSASGGDPEKAYEANKATTGVFVGADWDETDYAAGLATLLGQKVLHTDSKLVFIRREPEAAFYDRTAAEHVTATFEGIMHVRQPYTADGQAVGAATIEIATIDNGTDVPIIFAVDQTY